MKKELKLMLNSMDFHFITETKESEKNGNYIDDTTLIGVGEAVLRGIK
jgi:hypothetical protein